MDFIVRQPNGLLCRFSTITDCPTHFNMTDEEYIKFCQERAINEAQEILKNHIMPFSWVEEYFCTNNMSKEKFEEILKKMRRPAPECHAETMQKVQKKVEQESVSKQQESVIESPKNETELT